MRRALALASLAALVFGVFCTTKDVDYDPADLETSDDVTSVTSTTGSGGSGSGPTCDGTVCNPRTVEEALILDFDGDGAAGAAGAAGAPGGGGLDTFGDFGTQFSGGTFEYGEALESTIEDGAWHLSGSAGQGSGFGIYLDCQSDASEFSGIELTIRGDTGMQQLNMLIETASNISDACVGGTCSGGCVGAAAAINHTPGEQTWTFSWADFQDGSPDDTPDPSEITAIRWEFQATSPLPVDFYVDDIRFLD